ncbi:hypothetical protein RFI_16210 [Reticulomyxa filosa]|uniref:Telomerase reverse transcriptase n=1 Tax=Reticulomyxa filosa TaxID=46433 RepID=X6N3Z2_RETFI|nr:hypothetical protein RFI_16210 [Reticulomyxa filosa]|eukprot:ETO20995.1 hypothetical protein RFI_16210 [Reticulomyxa filosa]
MDTLSDGLPRVDNGDSSNSPDIPSRWTNSQASAIPMDVSKPILRLLMRHVDDSIFLTTSREEAVAFARILHAGINHYHVMANPDKTCANFELNGINPSHISSLTLFCYIVFHTTFLCFSRFVIGSLFNLSLFQKITGFNGVDICGIPKLLKFGFNLHFYVHNDIQIDIINSMVSQSSDCSNGTFVLRKLCQTLQQKILPLLLDGSINSLGTVILNCYQMFWVAGIKFIRILMSLPFHNLGYMFKVLQEAVEYSWKRVRLLQKNSSKNRNGKQDLAPFHFPLQFHQFDWIAARAFSHSIGDKHRAQFSRTFHSALTKWEQFKWKHIKTLSDEDVFVRMTDKNSIVHQQLWDYVF